MPQQTVGCSQGHLDTYRDGNVLQIPGQDHHNNRANICKTGRVYITRSACFCIKHVEFTASEKLGYLPAQFYKLVLFFNCTDRTESLQNNKVTLTFHSCVQWCSLYSLSTAPFEGHTAPHGHYMYKDGSWGSPSVQGDSDHTDGHTLREYIHTDRWPYGRMNALNPVDRTHMLEKRNSMHLPSVNSKEKLNSVGK